MTIQYGGETLTVINTDSDVHLHFKEHVASLNLIKKWVENRDIIKTRYMVGKNLLISERYDEQIQIGCLRDTKENFYSLLKLLSK